MSEVETAVLDVVAQVGNPLMSHFRKKLDYPEDKIKEAVRALCSMGFLRQKEDEIDHDWSYIRTRKDLPEIELPEDHEPSAQELCDDAGFDEDDTECLSCGGSLDEPGGYGGTGMCGPCATGDASTLEE